MNTIGMQRPRLTAANIPSPALFRSKWERLVRRSVTSSSLNGIGAREQIKKASPAASHTAASSLIPNLWVENGVIWQLPSLLIGFTNHSAASRFFSSLHGTGMGPAPSKWYQGIPFTSMDFPILKEKGIFRVQGWGGAGPNVDATVTYTVKATHLLVWARISALPNIQMFFSMTPVGPICPLCTGAGSPGPIFPPSALRSFSASSPNGTKTFHAEYVLYVAYNTDSTGNDQGIKYDLDKYCWSLPVKYPTAGGDVWSDDE